MMIPHSFGSDFGDQINRYVVLVDKNHNEFDVRIERINRTIFFTRGWAVLRDFYEITFGAWAAVLFLGLGRFQIKKIKCRVKNCGASSSPWCFSCLYLRLAIFS